MSLLDRDNGKEIARHFLSWARHIDDICAVNNTILYSMLINNDSSIDKLSLYPEYLNFTDTTLKYDNN